MTTSRLFAALGIVFCVVGIIVSSDHFVIAGLMCVGFAITWEKLEDLK